MQPEKAVKNITHAITIAVIPVSFFIIYILFSVLYFILLYSKNGVLSSVILETKSTLPTGMVLSTIKTN